MTPESTQAHQVTTLEQLLGLYGKVPVGAITKEQESLHPVYQALIEASPFCAFATVGPSGTDCTPRGDQPGFVKIIDDKTIEMADRKGNNRLDSLRNIIDDGRVSLLFLIPNRQETMRVNGRAIITTDPDTLRRHADEGREPATVIRISVDQAYLQCGKAMIRSKIWDPEQWADVADLPTTGQISASFRDGVDVPEYDKTLDERLRADLHQ